MATIANQSTKPELAKRIQEFRETSGDIELENTRRILKKLPYMFICILGLEGASKVEQAFVEAADWKRNSGEFVSWSDLEDQNFVTLERAKSLALFWEIETALAFGLFGIGDPQGYLHGHEGGHDLVSTDHGPLVLKEKLPSEWIRGTSLELIFEAVEARISIDGEAGDWSTSRRDSVSVPGLAALAGIELKTMQNSLTPSSGSGLQTIKIGPNKGRLLVEEARKWLEDRSGFRPTIYLLSENAPLVDEMQADDPIDPSGFIFLPVAKDGTRFEPSFAREGKFIIGAKDHELEFGDYQEALNALLVMRKPTWRRPDSSGRWRVVTGTHWARVSKDELGIK